jgi:hypothetical protein
MNVVINFMGKQKRGRQIFTASAVAPPDQR